MSAIDELGIKSRQLCSRCGKQTKGLWRCWWHNGIMQIDALLCTECRPPITQLRAMGGSCEKYKETKDE